MRAPSPAPTREMEAPEDGSDALEDRRLASMGGIDPAQTQGSVSRSGLSASGASSVLDETDVIAAAIAEQFPLDEAILRLRYTATEEQHRRIDTAALRRLCDDAGVHKLYAIEPTIIRPQRARVEGFNRDLDPSAALAAWATANEIPEAQAEGLHEILRESRATTQTGSVGAAFDPISLTARNVGRFPELHIDLQDGASVLLGANGSGKSTILTCLELALYADDAGDLRGILAPWADDLELELVFTLDGIEYRVRRALRAVKRSATNVPTGGKATLDFERRTVDGWTAITQETAKATQRLLVESIGMSRSLSRASWFLAQGDGPAFLAAEPKDRKAMAAQLLDPAGLWAADTAFANTQAKTIDAEITTTQTRIAALEETGAQAPTLEADLRLAREEHDLVAGDLTDAEQVLERALAAETGNTAAAERVKAAAAARDTAAYAVEQARQTAEHAQTEAAKLPAAREKLAALESLAAEIPELERQVEERRTAAIHVENLKRQKADADAAVHRHLGEIRRLQEQERNTDSLLTQATGRYIHLRNTEDGTERCDRCEQLLGAEARQAALASLNGQVEELTARKAAENEHHAEASKILDSLERAAEIEIPTVDLEDVSPRLAEARVALERIATGKLLIQGYEDLAASVDTLLGKLRAANVILGEREADLTEASAGVQDTAELAANVHQARQTVTTRKASVAGLAATVARLDERLTAATTAAHEAGRLTGSITGQQNRLDLYRLAEKAFGRDGIPVLLLETVLPQIDADANAILRRLPTNDGWTFQVRFETQREQASTDRLREELYVMVDAPDYSQDYRTLSGGEGSRVSFAIRVALAMLLARIRGADSRLLVLDELPFLDEDAEDTLVALVNELVDTAVFSKVLTVSHSPAVRDAFAQTIEITKNDGRSAVAHDEALVAA